MKHWQNKQKSWWKSRPACRF